MNFTHWLASVPSNLKKSFPFHYLHNSDLSSVEYLQVISNFAKSCKNS